MPIKIINDMKTPLNTKFSYQISLYLHSVDYVKKGFDFRHKILCLISKHVFGNTINYCFHFAGDPIVFLFFNSSKE